MAGKAVAEILGLSTWRAILPKRFHMEYVIVEPGAAPMSVHGSIWSDAGPSTSILKAALRPRDII